MHRTDWFHRSKYGVMSHFLPQPWKETERKYPFHESAELMSSADWNRLVDMYDVTAVVDQLKEVRAGYLLISLGQTSGYYLAPNPVYDRYCGFNAGSRCSVRDLPLDIHNLLDRHGMRLMLYLPIEPADEVAEELGRDSDASVGDEALPEAFVDRWASVIQWWSDHYGKKLAGWWFDGRGGVPAQAERLAEAARHGNPDCIINLNGFGDYLGGHCAIAHKRIKDPEWFGRIDWEVQSTRIPEGRFAADGRQWHALLHFGEHWWDRDGYYDIDTETTYTREVIRSGGVVTWDCGPNIGRNEGPVGTISEAQMAKLRRVRDAVWG
jgi:hypothetical protein